MTDWLKDCSIITKDKIITVEENKRKFISKHINHAFEQLANTLKVFKEKQLLHQKLTLVIVLSQYPKTTTNVQRWKKQLTKTFGAKFIIKNYSVSVKV